MQLPRGVAATRSTCGLSRRRSDVETGSAPLSHRCSSPGTRLRTRIVAGRVDPRNRLTNSEVNREELTSLGKLLGIFLALHVVYLLAAERLPHAWADHFGFWAITRNFLIGESAYFWLWTVVGGALPLAMLAMPSVRKRVSVIFAASVLAVFGTMFEGIRRCSRDTRSLTSTSHRALARWRVAASRPASGRLPEPTPRRWSRWLSPSVSSPSAR